jgi:hypothetical protein
MVDDLISNSLWRVPGSCQPLDKDKRLPKPKLED